MTSCPAGRLAFDRFDSDAGGSGMDGRTASGLALVVVVALMSACTAGSEPASTTTSAVPRAEAASPPPAVASSVTATPTPAVASSVTATPSPVITGELACAAPDEHALGWLQDRLRPDLPVADVVMVTGSPAVSRPRHWHCPVSTGRADGRRRRPGSAAGGRGRRPEPERADEELARREPARGRRPGRGRLRLPPRARRRSAQPEPRRRPAS
jgi:hypothetical protein